MTEVKTTDKQHQWCFLTSNNKWVAYPNEIQEKARLERVFCMGAVNDRNPQYLIDLNQCLQINVTSGTRRSIAFTLPGTTKHKPIDDSSNEQKGTPPKTVVVVTETKVVHPTQQTIPELETTTTPITYSLPEREECPVLKDEGEETYGSKEAVHPFVMVDISKFIHRHQTALWDVHIALLKYETDKKNVLYSYQHLILTPPRHSHGFPQRYVYQPLSIK